MGRIKGSRIKGSESLNGASCGCRLRTLSKTDAFSLVHALISTFRNGSYPAPRRRAPHPPPGGAGRRTPTITISTRLLRARPSAVALSATGRLCP